MKKTLLFILSLFLLSSFSHAEIWDDSTYTTGGQAFYPMLNTSNNVLDLSGNAKNGTASGSYSFYDDGTANMIVLDGSSSFIDIPNNFGIFTGSTDYTISMWINIKSFKDQTLIDFRGERTTKIGMVAGLCGGDNRQVWVWDSATVMCSGTQLNTSQWHHIVYTFDSGTSQKIYIDGILANSGSATSSISAATDDSAIGKAANAASEYVNGNITGLSIFNELKDQTWVTSISNFDYGYLFEINLATPNSITINSPTNRTYVYNSNQNVQITTALNSTCKYATNNTFNFYTQGNTFTQSNNITHNFSLDTTSDTTFEYYYKCNQSNGTITSSNLHTFKGKSLNWNNTFLSIGGSNVLATGSGVGATERYTYIVPNYLDLALEYWSISEVNKGIGSACHSNASSCSSQDPTINRLDDDVIAYNPRYFYLFGEQNDMYFGATPNDYIYATSAILDKMQIKAQNTTLISSTVMPNLETSWGSATEQKYSECDAGVREYAINNSIPFFELRYLLNYNATLYGDNVHLNASGHSIVNNTLTDLINNQNDYIMTPENFNIYHHCNNAISVLNMALVMPTATCDQTQANTDWLILKNITNSSLYIERSDVDFKLNITNLQYNSVYFFNFSNGTNYEVITTADGKAELILGGNDIELTYEVSNVLLIDEYYYTPDNIYWDDDMINITINTTGADTGYVNCSLNAINYYNKELSTPSYEIINITNLFSINDNLTCFLNVINSTNQINSAISKLILSGIFENFTVDYGFNNYTLSYDAQNVNTGIVNWYVNDVIVLSDSFVLTDSYYDEEDNIIVNITIENGTGEFYLFSSNFTDPSEYILFNPTYEISVLSETGTNNLSVDAGLSVNFEIESNIDPVNLWFEWFIDGVKEFFGWGITSINKIFTADDVGNFTVSVNATTDNVTYSDVTNTVNWTVEVTKPVQEVSYVEVDDEVYDSLDIYCPHNFTGHDWYYDINAKVKLKNGNIVWINTTRLLSSSPFVQLDLTEYAAYDNVSVRCRTWNEYFNYSNFTQVDNINKRVRNQIKMFKTIPVPQYTYKSSAYISLCDMNNSANYEILKHWVDGNGDKLYDKLKEYDEGAGIKVSKFSFDSMFYSTGNKTFNTGCVINKLTSAPWEFPNCKYDQTTCAVQKTYTVEVRG